MKKKFKLIVPSFLTLIFCLLLIAGSTYAIFSSQDQASIEVTSGKVDLSATIDILHVYSAEPVDAYQEGDLEAGSATAFGVTSLYKYTEILTPVEENQYAFATGGMAKLTSNKTLLLDKMVPGDRVTLKLNLKNSSNVDIKYRIIYSTSGDSDADLLSALVIKANGNAATSSVKGWTLLSAVDGDPESIDVELDVFLPIDTPSETANGTKNYQNKTVHLNFAVQAVQANAKTEDFASQISTNTGVTNLGSQSGLGQAEIQNSAFTPAANTSYVVELQVEEKQNGSVSIESNEGQKAFDVDVIVSKTEDGVTTTSSYDADDHNNKPITVTLNVGTGLVGVRLFHTHGTPSVTTEITDFEYNSAAGTITFEATEFSEYSVTYLMPIVDTVNNVTYVPQEDGSYKNQDTTDTTVYKYDSSTQGVRGLNDKYGFYDSYPSNGTWIHEITEKEHFQNIMYHIEKSNAGQEIDTVPYNLDNLGNKNTIYIINNNIDFQGKVWDDADDLSVVTSNIFTGKLIGKTIDITLSNATMLTHVSTNVAEDMFGLFDVVKDAEFSNLNFKNFTIGDGTDGKGAGIICAGHTQESTNATTVEYIRFSNIVIDSSCSVNIDDNGAGAFVGYLRGYEEAEFTNCTNNASIKGAKNIGGFAGSATYTSKFIFTNCTNNGEIIASGNIVGGFVGAGHEGGEVTSHITITNSTNNSNIIAYNGNNASPFIAAGSGNVPTDLKYTNVRNYGFIYTNDGKVNTSNIQDVRYVSDPNTDQITQRIYLGDETSYRQNDFVDQCYRVAPTAQITISFDNTYKLVVETTADESAIHHITVSVTIPSYSCLNSNGNWVGSGSSNVLTKTFNSLEDIDIQQLGYAGYFYADGVHTPSGVAEDGDPENPDRDFNSLHLNENNKNSNGYEIGWHQIEGQKAYCIYQCEVGTTSYKAFQYEWTGGQYSVTIYDAQGNILATGIKIEVINPADGHTILPYDGSFSYNLYN